MANYEIVFRKSVAKDFRNIPKKDTRHIIGAIRNLSDNPRPPQSKKLSGEEKYRLGVGDYRVLYSIEDNRLIICVVKVGPRKNIYRK